MGDWLQASVPSSLAISDLFDVLAYVAYPLPPLNREERAARAKVVISTHFNSKQQAFLDFVLAHYVSVGGRAVGPREAHALVAAQIPQLHLRRLSRLSTMVRSIQSLGMLLGSQLSFPSSRLNEPRHVEISHLDARASKLSALQQINGPFLTDGIVFSR